MDFELHPAITLSSRSFKVLYVTGNYSAVLSNLDRRFEALETRRGFTVFQLMTILEENHHSLIFVEHDPLLYEDAQEMTEYISQAMRDAAKEAAVLLYAPGADPFLEELIKNADRVFSFIERQITETRIAAETNPRAQRNQTTLEAFS